MGSDPAKGATLHPGGVLTQCIGLIQFANKQGHEVQVIDCSRSGMAQESLSRRVGAGAQRCVELVQLLRAGPCGGVIIFSSAGLGFYERSVMSMLCKVFGVKDLSAIVDGWFFGVREASWPVRAAREVLLKVPYRLVSSGSRWKELFLELGVPDSHIVSIYSWLPSSFVPGDAPKPAPMDRPVRFAFVGWMIKEKGVGELLESIAWLCTNKAPHQRFEVTFIGGGTLLEDVRAHIVRHGWQDFVFAPGWLMGDALHAALDAADVFVLPSYAEGFPMALIEALCKGMPVICTDVGGISDSLPNGVNGYLIPPRQAAPLAEAMQRYVADPALIPVHSAESLRIYRAHHSAEPNCAAFFDAFAERT